MMDFSPSFDWFLYSVQSHASVHLSPCDKHVQFWLTHVCLLHMQDINYSIYSGAGFLVIPSTSYSFVELIRQP